MTSTPQTLKEDEMAPDSVVVMEDHHTGAKEHMQNLGKGLNKGLKQTGTAVFSIYDDFKNFINKGNVVDLAVGIVMGAAFSAIVTSFVNDLITPIIGLAGNKNLENNFLILQCPRNPLPNDTLGNACNPGSKHSYTTIEQATTNGAVTWNYGRFFQVVINFFIISVIIFMLVKTYSAAFLRKKPAPKTKECHECLSADIPLLAKKCKHCQTILEVEVPSAAPTPTSGFHIPKLTSPFKRA